MQRVIPAVKAIIVTDSQFLVLKQAFEDKEVWDLPGGKMKYGESPSETLEREIKEEVSMGVEIGKLVGMWWFFRSDDEAQVVCSTYLCQAKDSAVDISNNPAQESIVEFRWVTKDEFLSGMYTVGHDSLKNLVFDLDM